MWFSLLIKLLCTTFDTLNTKHCIIIEFLVIYSWYKSFIIVVCPNTETESGKFSHKVAKNLSRQKINLKYFCQVFGI